VLSRLAYLTLYRSIPLLVLLALSYGYSRPCSLACADARFVGHIAARLDPWADGRSHSDAVVGSIVWSTTASAA
jgi:hypothetical protein